MKWKLEAVFIAVVGAFLLSVWGLSSRTEAQSYKASVKQHQVCVGTDPTYLVTSGSFLANRSSLIVYNNNASNAIFCSFDPSTLASNTGNSSVKVGTSSATLELHIPNQSDQPKCAAASAAQTNPNCTVVLQLRKQ